MPLTPEQRQLRARLAAYSRWSREDPAPNAHRAHAGLRARLAREVDPDDTLRPAERERRIDAALRAHMTKLAYKSSRARAQRRGTASTDGSDAA